MIKKNKIIKIEKPYEPTKLDMRRFVAISKVIERTDRRMRMRILTALVELFN